MPKVVWVKDGRLVVCGGKLVIGERDEPPPCACGAGWYRGDLCSCSDPTSNPPSVYIAQADYPGGDFVAPFQGCYQFSEANFIEQLPPGALVIPQPTVLFQSCAECCTTPKEPACCSLDEAFCFWPLEFNNYISMEWAFSITERVCCPGPAGTQPQPRVRYVANFFGEKAVPVIIDPPILDQCRGAEVEEFVSTTVTPLECTIFGTPQDVSTVVRATAIGWPQVNGLKFTASVGPTVGLQFASYGSCSFAQFDFDINLAPFVGACFGAYQYTYRGYLRINTTRIPCPNQSAQASAPVILDPAVRAAIQQQIGGCQGCG